MILLQGSSGHHIFGTEDGHWSDERELLEVFRCLGTGGMQRNCTSVETEMSSKAEAELSHSQGWRVVGNIDLWDTGMSLHQRALWVAGREVTLGEVLWLWGWSLSRGCERTGHQYWDGGVLRTVSSGMIEGT